MLPMAEPTQPAEFSHSGLVRESTYQKLAAYSRVVIGLDGYEEWPTEARVIVLN